MASLIGSKVERKEDKRFLTGRGQYTADINLANQSYAYFVRSPHARAKITNIDISKASKAPGVVKILTGDDIAREKVRVVYENEEIGIEHAFVTFKDGNTQAVMAVFKYKDGKIISLETGATNILK